MIDKREILEAASALQLVPSVIEKDYVLGWVLAGINALESISDKWVFKGGTCLKKCYFETYRFSEDLDFTLRDESQIEEVFLRSALAEVATWVTEQSGLSVPVDQIKLDIYTNPRGNTSCQGRIAYRGPVSPTSGGWPKIKLDLTADERLVLPALRQEIFHPYSDRPEEGLWINCYAYEEAFAEKLRALGERTRPRDLYDVVNLYRHADNRPSASVVRDALQQKCEYKGIAIPTIEALKPHQEALAGMWNSMLAHQLPTLPPLSSFWAALPEILSWITSGEAIPRRTQIQHGAGETAIRTRVLPLDVSAQSRSTLEAIRFAAGNHLCVDLTYGGRVSRIEPYSLRRTLAGNVVLHAIRTDSGEHRSYRVDRIQGATITQQSFSPQYLVELTPTGPLAVLPSTANPRVAKTRHTESARQSGPTYVYRCTVCHKTFNRKRMDNSLNPHKHPHGYPCPGRTGIYVRTKY